MKLMHQLAKTALIVLAAMGCGSTDPVPVDVQLNDTAASDSTPDQKLPDVAEDVPFLDVGTEVRDELPDLSEPDTTPDSGDTSIDPGFPLWGWISVIEWNDTCDQWYLKTQWLGGIRAHFAAEPSYNRALPHTLGFASPVMTVGSCTLYDSGLMSDECLGMCLCLDKGVECYNDDRTERWCGQDEFCEAGEWTPERIDHGHCVPLPEHYSAGQIDISGLKEPVSMSPDEFDRYMKTADNPNDLFDQGDVIRATTTGGELPPFSFETTGVAPLEVTNQVVMVKPNQSSTIKWTPADGSSRIQIFLAAGSHDPNPLGGAIICDVNDSDGQVDVDYSLLERLWYLGCDGQWMMKCSRITRYTRDVKTVGNQEIELFAGSARNLQLIYQ